MEADFDPFFATNSNPRLVLLGELVKEYSLIKSLSDKYWYFKLGGGLTLYKTTIANIEESINVLENSSEQSIYFLNNLLLRTNSGIEAIYSIWIEGYEHDENKCTLLERVELKNFLRRLLVVLICDSINEVLQ